MDFDINYVIWMGDFFSLVEMVVLMVVEFSVDFLELFSVLVDV